MICPLCKEDVRSSVGLLGLVRHLIHAHRGFIGTRPPFGTRLCCPCGFAASTGFDDELHRGEGELEGHFLALPNFHADPMGTLAHHFAEARLKP